MVIGLINLNFKFKLKQYTEVKLSINAFDIQSVFLDP